MYEIEEEYYEEQGLQDDLDIFTKTDQVLLNLYHERLDTFGNSDMNLQPMSRYAQIFLALLQVT